jgi:exodeoxyribonuclease VII large subunit
MTDKNARIYNVAELTREVRFALEETFDGIWVEGEISNFRVPASGHSYFGLKDKNAMLKCVMFKTAGSKLKFEIEDGMSVLCFGKIGVYEQQGQYQLYVEKVEPKGEGALHAAFERLKKKLYDEGLFDEERKKAVPFLPSRIGVVTSGTGAAIKDILKVARRRFANIEITVCPVKVQGDDAKDEIVDAIEILNEYNRHIVDEGLDEHLIDSMIVGRGGGSIEDLWAFNEEIVARAIADSEIPVISAVGHEIDYTIADFVADQRAATPSAAAELVIPRKDELTSRVKDREINLDAAMEAKLSALETQLSNLSDKYVLREPVNVLLQLEQQVDDFDRRSGSEIRHCVELFESRFNSINGKLCTLSPLSVLERGYSITFADGEIIKDVDALKKGDRLVTRFARGEVNSRVEK